MGRLSENSRIVADYFGSGRAIDVSSVMVEFELAAQVGKNMGMTRCKQLFLRCETSVDEMMEMIETEYKDVVEMEADIHDMLAVENMVLKEESDMINEMVNNGIDPGRFDIQPEDN